MEDGPEKTMRLPGDSLGNPVHQTLMPKTSITEIKEKMEIYNLTGKDDIWWKDRKKVKIIKEQYVTWKTFNKYCKRKLLTK